MIHNRQEEHAPPESGGTMLPRDGDQTRLPALAAAGAGRAGGGAAGGTATANPNQQVSPPYAVYEDAENVDPNPNSVGLNAQRNKPRMQQQLVAQSGGALQSNNSTLQTNVASQSQSQGGGKDQVTQATLLYLEERQKLGAHRQDELERFCVNQIKDQEAKYSEKVRTLEAKLNRLESVSISDLNAKVRDISGGGGSGGGGAAVRAQAGQGGEGELPRLKRWVRAEIGNMTEQVTGMRQGLLQNSTDGTLSRDSLVKFYSLQDEVKRLARRVETREAETGTGGGGALMAAGGAGSVDRKA